MINTETNDPPKFLDETPNENDKVIWKRAYASYLIATGKTPEACAHVPYNLAVLLPILGELDPRWNDVKPDMMKTSHTMVHRMNVLIKRFKGKVWAVKVVMQDIREHQDQSAEADQTVNPERTDSEKSYDEQEQAQPTQLGLMNERSVFGDPDEEVKTEKNTEKPQEQAVDHELPQSQTLQQEYVEVQTQTEDDQILQRRKRNEDLITDDDLGLYGADVVSFLKARDAVKRAKKDLKQAEGQYNTAKADLTDLQANFNAAFESSEEKK